MVTKIKREFDMSQSNNNNKPESSYYCGLLLIGQRPMIS